MGGGEEEGEGEVEGEVEGEGRVGGWGKVGWDEEVDMVRVVVCCVVLVEDLRNGWRRMELVLVLVFVRRSGKVGRSERGESRREVIASSSDDRPAGEVSKHHC